MKVQDGFTLLELMVAMAIFAMLAVAGWQVFDSVNRARERAQFHADNVAALQYAYLQLQQDMGQVIPYQAPNNQNMIVANSNNSTNGSTNGSTNSSVNNSNPANEVEPAAFMSLDGEHISFMRFADPDPRYQSSVSVQHVEYVFADERLIRRQYTSTGGGRDGISLDSVLLEGVTAGRWQAYLPKLSSKFPDAASSSSDINSSANVAAGPTANSDSMKPDVVLLPKGVAINFTYQDMPITWQWALTPQSIPRSRQNTANNKNDNGNANGNGDSSNNNGGNNGSSNDNTPNDNFDNNNNSGSNI